MLYNAYIVILFWKIVYICMTQKDFASEVAKNMFQWIETKLRGKRNKIDYTYLPDLYIMNILRILQKIY